MSDAKVRIYDIMACNVYWDFDESPLPREQHKFLVSFWPTGDVPAPDLIDRIVARGPGGYEVEFANRPFTNRDTNGHIYDPTLDYYWYMVNLPTGFMDEGEYTIEVTCKDGTVLAKSRVQDNGSADAVVSAYTGHRAEIRASFSPSGDRPLPAGAPLTGVRSSWATLRDLADVDAYYIYRIAEASSAREFDTQRLVWWDNIFIQRAGGGEAGAGRNRGEVAIGTELRPGTSYGYFVEITDGNVQGETNVCVFQPHQFFTTPSP
jgi:hypothetical protein